MHRKYNKKRSRTYVCDLFCGDKEIRTPDPLLAKQVLYQLSYTPEVVGPGRVELPTSTLSV